MIVKRYIKVLVSVGVIFMMMLHLAIPHAHHHHEDKKVVSPHGKNDHHHTEGHDHHHPVDKSTATNTDKTGISNPSEKHLHAFHVHEFIFPSQSKNHTSSIKAFPLLAVVIDTESRPQTENKTSFRFALFRQIIYENPFLLSCSLRAPPYSA